jgi:hypothetical protein
MDLRSNIGGKVNSSLIIKSLLWASIVSTMKEKKDIELEGVLKSISIKGSTIFIKTQAPHINFEIESLEYLIKDELKKKLLKVGVSFNDFELRYL